MGYRLDISKIEKGEIKSIYYGTKLYGYTDESKLLSYIYLVSIGKLDYDEFFNYGSNQMICLNKKEFTIFCYLYNIDYNVTDILYHEGNDGFINEKNIKKELMKDIIEEYDNSVYLISWS